MKFRCLFRNRRPGGLGAFSPVPSPGALRKSASEARATGGQWPRAATGGCDKNPLPRTNRNPSPSINIDRKTRYRLPIKLFHRFISFILPNGCSWQRIQLYVLFIVLMSQLQVTAIASTAAREKVPPDKSCDRCDILLF